MHYEAQVNDHLNAEINFSFGLLAQFQIVDNWIYNIVLHYTEEMHEMIDTQELSKVSVLDVVVIVECHYARKSGEHIEEEGSLQILLSNFSTSIHSVYISCERSTEAEDDIDNEYGINHDFVILGCCKNLRNVGTCRIWNKYAFQKQRAHEHEFPAEVNLAF